MNQNDVYSEFKEARKEREEILKLLSSLEGLEITAKAAQQKEVDLDILLIVAVTIQQAEEVHKQLERYIQRLRNLIRNNTR